METILIVLDPAQLENPDLDIRYELPDKVEQYTNHELCDDGYDYLEDDKMGIWLTTKSAKEDYVKVIEVFEKNMVCGNDLTGTAKVYISDKEAAPLEECTLVYDGQEQIPDATERVKKRAKKVGTIIMKVAELLTNDDKAVIDALKIKLAELEDTEQQWNCFNKTLKDNQYIIECDEDMEFAEFLELLLENTLVKSKTIPVDKSKLDADDELYEWCEALDEQWKDAGLCMAIYELEDGKEAVFPCNTEKLEEISEWAKEICISIVAVAEY